MSDENMKRRTQINAAELKVGNLFFGTPDGDDCFEVLAVGPEYYGYTPDDWRAKRVHVYGLQSALGYCSKHKDVWIDAPRTTVGEFLVGEKIALVSYADRAFQITAVGERTSLARCIGIGKYVETMFRHDRPATEVKE